MASFWGNLLGGCGGFFQVIKVDQGWKDEFIFILLFGVIAGWRAVMSGVFGGRQAVTRGSWSLLCFSSTFFGTFFLLQLCVSPPQQL
jgi:hypothetical protein